MWPWQEERRAFVEVYYRNLSDPDVRKEWGKFKNSDEFWDHIYYVFDIPRWTTEDQLLLLGMYIKPPETTDRIPVSDDSEGPWWPIVAEQP